MTELINLTKVRSNHLALAKLPVRYGFGDKARATAKIGDFLTIDCSGYFYWQMADASERRIIVPHGSQNQLAWAEENLREVDYSDAARYMTKSRLFAFFLKPWTNGCGKIGHVGFMITWDKKPSDNDAKTLESRGGKGVDSRDWKTPVLARQVYKCFEIPTLENLRK